MINFCYDDLGDFGIGYPNLARRDIQPWEFDDTWPRTVPLRLLMYMVIENIPHSAKLVSEAPIGSWYPIAWAWHDFDCDYIGLLQSSTKDRLRNKEIRVLFYYHEGDNPEVIIRHLRQRCHQHHVPEDCFLLISANTAADRHAQSCYFPDHEYFFRYLNKNQSPKRPNAADRPFTFTALNRLHKSWRAMIMADLHQQGLLANSLWSYNTEVIMDHADSEHPLDHSAIPGWNKITEDFLGAGPYFCDAPDPVAHNDHTQINTNLYTDSYCHIIIETLLDADNSGGSFLTEKTYKCIKFGQPFVIVGAAGSLQQLRNDGYKVFDDVVDNSYDSIADPTKRYLAVRQVLADIQSRNQRQFFEDCLPDLIHNQSLFLDMRSFGLSRVLTKLS